MVSNGEINYLKDKEKEIEKEEESIDLFGKINQIIKKVLDCCRE